MTTQVSHDIRRNAPRRGRALRASALAALLPVLAACAPAPDVGERLQPAVNAAIPAPRFDSPRPYAPARSNTEIAHDILELGFFLESGREIPRFSRFEGPVALALTGEVPRGAVEETDRLLARIRTEAGIDIRRTGRAPAQITVEFVPGRQLRREVPQAACFVVPNVSDWSEFRAARRSDTLDWTRVIERTRVGVFIPSDTTPQEIRDCLHEEIAQAMGPLNDLYRLQDSVFNDDNFQTVLTGFDMLVLRVWTAPELRSGMTQAQVAERLPAILARKNPRGERAFSGTLPDRSPRAWVNAVETALGRGGNRAARQGAATTALAIASARGWEDARMAFSLYLVARFAPASAGETALAALMRAQAIYHTLPGGEVHAAHMDMHMATQALAAGQNSLVLTLTGRAMDPARRTENAALQATLMLLRAEALQRLGRQAEADALRRNSIPLAAWGFGRPDALDSRIAEIAALR
ncbi:DUF2927 domain-containing protein [Rhodobacteraceae bacterium 2376]|uniref:DUF2927 domain-containing protein n=1 Tax=Rhabdonatronobacter sediminivivens TaxID=2743469 RepID=A0A7Z0KWW4_9RHOB|nr:DUF2927 domain-containing protein [Rhabdonatronobacter sediminivivens]NYS24049.1 DUF2927 domain-containing protein [Rhabdonatronobacter sediminivivens]